MRIISGSHRGRTIHPPAGFTARPTTDMAKEALFNILENRYDLNEVTVLDLFGGTGSISYEFASRGANEVWSVELDYKNADFIRKTSSNLNLPIKCVRSNVFSFLKSCRLPYDIIFADPPYDMPEQERIHELIYNNKLLKESGCFIIEHSAKKSFKDLYGYSETRKYGKVHFSFFVFEK